MTTLLFLWSLGTHSAPALSAAVPSRSLLLVDAIKVRSDVGAPDSTKLGIDIMGNSLGTGVERRECAGVGATVGVGSQVLLTHANE